MSELNTQNKILESSTSNDSVDSQIIESTHQLSHTERSEVSQNRDFSLNAQNDKAALDSKNSHASQESEQPTQADIDINDQQTQNLSHTQPPQASLFSCTQLSDGEIAHDIKPPLAFSGNKKNLREPFLRLIDTMQAVTKDTIFLDIFGGSGFLSHHLKRKYPHNEVIWNDYDDYQNRLNIAHHTELHRQELVKIIHANGEQIRKNTEQRRLNPQTIAQIKDYLSAQDEATLDCVQLSSWLCFGGRYCKTKQDLLSSKAIKYNCISLSPLNITGYLRGVTRIQKDYKEILAQYKDNPNAFLILDPPYLQTDQAHYAQHFRLKDSLHLFDYIFNVDKSVVFFSSENSHCLELLEFLSDFYNKPMSFKTYKVALNNSKCKSKDIMFYKSRMQA